MKPILTIDVGAGTTDILVVDPDRGEHYKAVAVSPVRRISRAIFAGRGDLLITGSIMGGGAVSKAVIQRAQAATVYMTPEAAGTINDDLSVVRKKGIRIVSGDEATVLSKNGCITTIEFGDISISGTKVLLEEMGVAWNFSFVAGAVQDHGVCPEGISPLDFRHQVMKERIEKDARPESLFFSHHDIPAFLTRMKATANLLSEFPCEKLFMMDTGMAAIVGASLDPQVLSNKPCIVSDIGNSHTLAAVLDQGLVGGFFEYHTNSVTAEKMDSLLVKLGDGDLSHEEVLAEDGHGAYIREVPGFDGIDTIVVTGPRREEVMSGTEIPHREGAPLGDNMMTGTAGLVACIGRREGIDVIRLS